MTNDNNIDNRIFEKIDELIEKSPEEAELFMNSSLEKSMKEGNDEVSLKLYNELIGYYRQTSEKDKLITVIGGVCELLDKMDQDGTINYATTMLNIANAKRSIGELKAAEEYYAKTEAIYNKAIAEGKMDKYDICVAGLYNNMSLLYQEMLNYKKAEELLKKALFIVTEKNERFEIAVTYANLANTMLLSKDYALAYKYAKEATSRFKARNYIDAHYCAALSAIAYCHYEWGNIHLARCIFEQAANIVKNTIGMNGQYERLIDSIKMCENNETCTEYIKGIELSRLYFDEYGREFIETKFKEYKDSITVGLIGEGSDCYGFDDEYSADHDYGPAFCIFVDDEAYEKISEELTDFYNSLPNEFMGYKRQETALGYGRRGVIKTSDFYIKHIGCASFENIDYKKVSDYELAVCTNGQVFFGGNSEFLKIRNELLKGYPDDIRLIKLAEDVASFSQAGQYNYKRMEDREDELTSQLMIADFSKKAMVLYHHLMNVYAPHDKWLKKSTLNILGGNELIGLIEKVTNMVRLLENKNDIANEIDNIGSYFALKLYEKSFISDIDPYLANHSSELMFKASVCMLSKEELVDRIVRIEFKAFDEVKNEGGRASCQNNWPVFRIMRSSQYLIWNKDMLIQYLYDFTREYEGGHNLITEKYGRMMESTAPLKYEEIKAYFPVLSEQKKSIIEQIVSLQLSMTEEFGKEYPKVASNARDFHTYEDDNYNTSSETYLRGEISTYSDKMLQLYAGFVIDCVRNNINITKETITNTARLYGYKNLEDLNK